MLKDVRSPLMAPATALPSGLVNATRCNQPFFTSTPTRSLGATLEAPVAGLKATSALAGASVALGWLVEDLPLHAASTPEAPTAIAVSAWRRLRVTCTHGT